MANNKERRRKGKERAGREEGESSATELSQNPSAGAREMAQQLRALVLFQI